MNSVTSWRLIYVFCSPQELLLEHASPSWISVQLFMLSRAALSSASLSSLEMIIGRASETCGTFVSIASTA